MIAADTSVVVAAFATSPQPLNTPERPCSHATGGRQGHVDNLAIVADGAAYAYGYAAFSSVLYVAKGVR